MDLQWTRVLIISSTLLAVVIHPASAQQGSQPLHTARLSPLGRDDIPTTDMIVTDSTLLPLVGMSDHIEGRLAFLRTELKITHAQLALWDAFAAAARENATQENELLTQEYTALNASDAGLTLPQRLEAHEKRLKAHLKMLQRIAAALQPLYASFSDEQKKSAEALVNGPAGL